MIHSGGSSGLMSQMELVTESTRLSTAGDKEQPTLFTGGDKNCTLCAVPTNH
jgi:hypothetical protein